MSIRMNLQASTALGALMLALSVNGPAFAQTALPPVAVDSQPVEASTLNTEAVSKPDLAAKSAVSNDTASLLTDAPGVSLQSNGGFAGLPSVHGLLDDNIKTLLDGAPISASCPNHMNPVLSYIAPSQVGKAEVIAGITPVSLGGDSIGGTIIVEPKSPVFASGSGVTYGGEASTFWRSNGNALTFASSVYAASDKVSLGFEGSHVRSQDYKDGDGNEIHSSQYQNNTSEGILAFQNDVGKLVVRGGYDYAPYEGFPNAVMDMTENRSYHANVHYEGEFGWGSLEARAYWQDVTHQMNFFYGRDDASVGSGMPMFTHGEDVGYSLKAALPIDKQDELRVGNEYHAYTLNDWWPPTSSTANGTMSPNTFININNGTRDVLGTYVEWEKGWNKQWSTLFGVRNDTVFMNTGNVAGYSSSNGAMADYGYDSTAFNSVSHAKTDINFDITALATYRQDSTFAEQFGYARKTESPNLYERYAWSSGGMAANMIGWFGDVQNYMGNVDLKPQSANIISTTSDWHDAAGKDWQVKFTPYYNYIQNYIGVNYLTKINGHSIMDGVLQFANHDSEMFGADLSGKKALASNTQYGDFNVAGKLGWTRGLQVDNGENMYHVMPLNASVSLLNKLGGWTTALDVQGVSSKVLVDDLRNEPTTPGYALVNLHTTYSWQNVTASVGVDNVFDKQYYSPLGGVDYGDWRFSHSGAISAPYPALPGMGRSFNTGVTVKF